MKFPAELMAGLTLKASAVLPDYPAPDWTVTAHLRGPAAIDLTATADGTGHNFDTPAATTQGWAPGTYWATLRATDGTDVFQAAAFELEILPDLAAVSGAYDGRTENEKALDAINAVLAKKATQDQMRYTVSTPSGQRELWRTPIPELLKLQAFFKAAVRREKNAAKGVSAFGRQIHVRFK